MPTFVHAPEVRVYIGTDKKSIGTVDVSNDLVSGTMTRRSDGVSTFDFNITNQRRKYDLVFTPNDRIVVLMKRINWVHVFSGYLNSVPLVTGWPRDVSLSASCSLKRLQYYYWNPYATDSLDLLQGVVAKIQSQTDANIGVSGGLLVAVLSVVAGWPAGSIHLGLIPSNWKKTVAQIAAQVKKWEDTEDNYLQKQFDHLGDTAVVSGSPASQIRAAAGDAAASAAATGGAYNDGTNSYGDAANAGITGKAALTWSGTGNLTGPQVAAYAYNAGFRGYGLTQAVAVSFAEDGSHNPKVLNSNSNGTVDRGLWQINSVHDANYPASQTLTPAGAAKAAFSLSAGGTDWHIWATNKLSGEGYVNKSLKAGTKAYDQIPAANAAIAQMQKTMSGDTSVAGTTGAAPAALSSTIAAYERVAVQYGMCLHDCAEALIHTSSGIGTAAEAWQWAQVHGVAHVAEEPPPGTIGLYTGGEAKDGHAVVGLGNGWVLSPGVPTLYKWNLVKYTDLTHGDLSYGGYTTALPAGRLPGSAGTSGTAPRVTTVPRTSTPKKTKAGGTGIWPVWGYKTSSGGKKTPDKYFAPEVLWRYKAPPTSPSHPGSMHDDDLAASDPTNAIPDNANVYHSGVDFYGEYGQAVYAVAGGTVVSTGTHALFGTTVVINTGGLRHYYAHLSSTSVSAGATVKAGQQVGAVGNSGTVLPEPKNSGDHTSGVHLHFEVRKSPYTDGALGSLVDPMVFIETGFLVSAAAGNATTGGTTGSGSGSSGAGSAPIIDTPSSVSSGGTAYDSGSSASPYGSSSLAYDPASQVDTIFGDQATNISSPDLEEVIDAQIFTGVYALTKDSTVLTYVQTLCTSSMRSFCSAPNGDFIAWFPDYYGIWGTAGIMKLEDIEIVDFNVTWTDDNFVTHQFIQGNGSGLYIDPSTGLLSGDNFSTYAMTKTTAGVANIDSPIIMAALFGVPPSNNGQQFNQYVYQKFGARPSTKTVNVPYKDNASMFFMALYYFMLQWAYQYQATIPITFMPEVWPGMLIQVQSLNFQAYVTSVTHCQPEGTMVRVPDTPTRELGSSLWNKTTYRDVPIETLREGDRVVSWIPRSSTFSKTGQVVNKISVIPYDGDIIVAAMDDGAISKYAPNHNCIIKLGDSLADGNFIVYLMRRNGQYRVGKTRWNYSTGSNGPIRRTLNEDGDAVWILSVHHTEQGSSMNEALVQTKFGLPSESFIHQRNHPFDLSVFWGLIGDNSDRAIRCLTEFGLLIDYPFWQIDGIHLGRGVPKNSAGSSKHRIVTAAINLRSGMKMLRVGGEIGVVKSYDTDDLRQGWMPVRISRESYRGNIYSLSVERDHTYIADGMVTHNSFQFGEGGSFETQLNICAPAVLKPDAKGDGPLIGLPRAGGYNNWDGQMAPDAYSQDPTTPVATTPKSTSTTPANTPPGASLQ